MNRETNRIARKRAERTTIIRNVSTSQRRYIEKIIMNHAEDWENVINLTDSDGVQQFILGVTPLDDTVRIGQLP